MADIEWHYIENQFDNSTKDSYKRAKQQAIYHMTAVGNAPGGIVAALTSRINAVAPPYIAKYEEWHQKRGLLKGATQSLADRVELLGRTEIEEIETMFKSGYKRGTPEHTSAFPQGREPFQHGGADERIAAAGNLSVRCAALTTPLLAGLADAQANAEPQGVIDDWQRRVFSMQGAQAMAAEAEAELIALRTAQDDLETEAELARTQIEPLRMGVADALYANLGALMQALNTEALRPQISAYFNLDILRETSPEEEEPPVVTPPPTPTP